MRSLLSLVAIGLLVGCSGGNEAEAPPVSVPPPVPTVPTQPVPVVVPLLQNANVNCGLWNQQLEAFVPPYTKKNHQRWVIMGSSSAFGAGASSYASSWAGLLTEYAKGEGIEVINIAKGGYLSYQGLSSRCEVSASRFQPDANHNVDKALELNPDLVIVSFPSNDSAYGYPAEESAFNLLLMRELLAREEVVTVVMGAQPRNMAANRQQQLLQLDTLLDERIKACLVKVYEPLVDSAGNLAAQFNAGDGVHVNDAGHAILYERLHTVLTDASKGCLN